ncbi:MAG TPA: ECF-type sigma factor [Rubricoccaceae bacterium]
MEVARSDVTRLLLSARPGAGAHANLDRLLPLVYDELRRLASRHLRAEAAGHTFATTDLVHEAYARLVDQREADWQSRAHFMAIAATAMRRILLQHARDRRALKRNGGARPLALDDVPTLAADEDDGLVALDEALDRLAALDARLARVVECRYFGGMTADETAIAVGVSERTVKRDWRTARAWLYAALAGEG